MKTFLEQLKHNVSPSYNLREILDNLTDDQIINEVNDYATEVAKESLKNAAKYSFLKVTEDNTIVIDKKSILSHDNIPKL